MIANVIERFEDKFIPEPNSGCWLWLGAFKKSGYGSFRIDAEKIAAHRASWMLYRGPLTKEWVLHRCDNPACVNPDHLFLGDCASNAADRERKGRGAKGERSARSKLTEAQAGKIFRDPRPYKEIAADFGVSKNAVTHIKSGRCWGHVNRGMNQRGSPRGEAVGGAKLAADDVRKIRSDTRTHSIIARDFGVSRASVGLIKLRKNWKHIP